MPPPSDYYLLNLVDGTHTYISTIYGVESCSGYEVIESHCAPGSCGHYYDDCTHYEIFLTENIVIELRVFGNYTYFEGVHGIESIYPCSASDVDWSSSALDSSTSSSSSSSNSSSSSDSSELY